MLSRKTSLGAKMQDNNQISRKQALKRGLGFYFTGNPCKRGHIAERYVSNCTCVQCVREKDLNTYWSNPEASRKRVLRYAQENKEKVRLRNADWRKRNKDHLREYESRRWLTQIEDRRSSLRQWCSKNRDKARALGAARRAAEMKRTPQWADRNAIGRVYAQARLAEAVTGFPHHVDHIVPLRGKGVSGLHVPWNLQVLEASENLRKGNRC